MMRRHRCRRGSALLEFTFVGIPLMFVLISIFEISRGMWIYDTLAHAVKEGTRFAIVHGHNCTIWPNSCSVTIREIAQRIEFSGVGLVPSELQDVTFISATRTVTCPTLQTCLDGGGLGDTFWPALPAGATGYPDVGAQAGSAIQITARYPFASAIAMFWPGAGPGMTFGTFMLPGSSQETIRY